MKFTDFLKSWLVSYRSSRKMSGVKMAALLGVTSQTLGKWERGEMEPGVGIVDRIAERLNIQILKEYEKANG